MPKETKNSRVLKQMDVKKRGKVSQRSVADAGTILRKRYGDDNTEQYVREERERIHIAQDIYAARKAKGLSQARLAAMIGTTASAICRLESADYERYSVPTLKKIADALGMRLEIRLISNQKIVG